ncbi:hypothetical protein AX16_009550 [Volvariella volvacea WC 439]|nr:hypothetical protein AX16_009550 [Volvariella volvacea WC 439]
MPRLPFLALLALSCLNVALSGPVEYQVALQANDAPHTTDSWSYVDCGLPSDVIQIESISVSPDPPQPGKDLTVRVKGKAKEEIEVCFGCESTKLPVLTSFELVGCICRCNSEARISQVAPEAF